MIEHNAPLQALIADDEPPARKRLKKLLQPMAAEGRLELIGEAGDGLETLERLESADVDLLFLDIQMPELNGFDVLERLNPTSRPIVIFTTAFDSYALRAFEANAVDYLLKPISRERLDEAVERAERLRRLPAQRAVRNEKLEKLLEWLDSQSALPETASSRADYLKQLSVPYRDRILIISVDRLVSAEIAEGITRIFVFDDEGPSEKRRIRQHVVNYTLDQLEASLPPDRFMRVHRSAIVNLDHIQELVPWFSGRFKLILTGEHEVIASRERSKHLKDALML